MLMRYIYILTPTTTNDTAAAAVDDGSHDDNDEGIKVEGLPLNSDKFITRAQNHSLNIFKSSEIFVFFRII